MGSESFSFEKMTPTPFSKELVSDTDFPASDFQELRAGQDARWQTSKRFSVIDPTSSLSA